MLTTLQLENWKSFKKAELNIDPLTVLIGTNASGKSNSLDALAFLNRIASGVMLTSALKGDSGLPAIRGGIEWAARKPGNSFALKIIVRTDISTDYEYKIECNISEKSCDLVGEQLTRIKYRIVKEKRKWEIGRINLIRTDTPSEESPTIVARLYNGKSGIIRQLGRSNSVLFQLMGQNLRQEIQDGIDTVLADLRGIFILDPIPSHMRRILPLSDRLDSDASNIAGVIAALPEEKKKQIEDVLSGYARRLPERDIHRVYVETVGKFSADAMLYCEEYWCEEIDVKTENSTPPTVDARGMSDGTLRFLAVLTALLTRPAGTLLVIEEVDNGLHPSRASLLLEVLKDVGAKRNIDVLVTTHNPALMDAMGTEMLPFITVAHRDLTQGDSVLTLLEDIQELPKLLAQGSIGKLAGSGLLESSLSRVEAGEKE
jgi:predicted ATPase